MTIPPTTPEVQGTFSPAGDSGSDPDSGSKRVVSYPLPPSFVSDFLRKHHYLGPARRGFSITFPDGCMVFCNPSSRSLPHDRWVELSRWCIVGGGKNAGSRQWKEASAILRQMGYTTVVSYSDPSAGHTGSLYRACNWLWAPTWHRLRTPPSGLGSWDGKRKQEAKDRWVFLLRKDTARAEILRLKDDAVNKKYPWASYREPHKGVGGGDYQRFKREILHSPSTLTSHLLASP